MSNIEELIDLISVEQGNLDNLKETKKFIDKFKSKNDFYCITVELNRAIFKCQIAIDGYCLELDNMAHESEEKKIINSTFISKGKELDIIKALSVSTLGFEFSEFFDIETMLDDADKVQK